MEEKSLVLNNVQLFPKPIIGLLKLKQNDSKSFEDCLKAINEYKQTLLPEDTLDLTIEGEGVSHSYYEIEYEQLRGLGEALATITQLKSLTLKGWGGVDFNSSSLFIDFFKKIAFLERIAFNQCDIYQCIEEDIFHYTRPRELSFSDCSNELSTLEFMESLTDGLEKNTNLKKLSLVDNDLDLFADTFNNKHAMQDFLEVVSNHPTLEEIDLRGNAWTTAVVRLKDGRYTYLKSLWDEHKFDHLNYFLNVSAKSITHLLTHSNQLKKLYLGFKKGSKYILETARCADEVIEEIAKAITHNTTVTDLSFSHLSFKSMKFLVDALERNFTLLNLEITSSDNQQELREKRLFFIKRNRSLKAGIDFLQSHFPSIQKWIETNEPIDSIILQNIFAIILQLMEYKKIKYLADNCYLSNQIEALIDSFNNQLLPALFPTCVMLFAEQLMQPEKSLKRNTGIEIFILHLFGIDINLPFPMTKEENEENKKSKFKLILLIGRYYFGNSFEIRKIIKYCLVDYLGFVDYSDERIQAQVTIPTILKCDKVLTVSQFLSLLVDAQNNLKTIEAFKETRLYDQTIVIYEQALLERNPKVIRLKEENLSDLRASHLILKEECIKQEKALLEELAAFLRGDSNKIETNVKQLNIESEMKERGTEEKSTTNSQQPSITTISLFKVDRANNSFLPPLEEEKDVEERKSSPRVRGQQ